uniref:Peptidoglycan hydrolase VirB1, involved in T-DNA transfer n=1 Tax=Pseudomonas syringae pv. actinidiae TaxID=103796 RepID=A0A2P0QFP5_PSESF|nr:lytic transglycosylase domain-containing protein [Pseudomonas syringae]ARO45221.1 Peptidoglycan hydrolase VirB1, involved in T-DNA transfer [Pseudomonas syringae pv. actinidiae]
MQKLPKLAVAVLAIAVFTSSASAEDATPQRFSELAAKCAQSVHVTTLKGLVGNESSFNPYAIGVVGGHLERQPKSLAEAIATAQQLERDGLRYSMGLGQLLVTNMRAGGLSYEDVFHPCRNLQASSKLLTQYYVDALKTSTNPHEALLKATSRYYSGNEIRGFSADKPGDLSYVEKVISQAQTYASQDPVVPLIASLASDQAIPVILDKPSAVVPSITAQSGDQAYPLREPQVSASKARERARRPSNRPEGQWLTFADENGQPLPPKQTQRAQDSKPQIQVQLDTGDDPSSAQAERQFKSFDQDAASAATTFPERSDPNSAAQQSFVQIVN